MRQCKYHHGSFRLYIEFGFFFLHQNMANTNSASRFRSASIEVKKELLSIATPQNTKSCTKFAFNVFGCTSKLHSNFTRQPFY